MKNIILLLLASISLWSCTSEDSTADAYGNFETDETKIAAEANGKLLFFNVEEGQILKAGEKVGQIDTLALYYKKQQLLAQDGVLGAQLQNIDAQWQVAEQQVKNVEVSVARVQALAKDHAATQKQLDDALGQQKVVMKQRDAIAVQKSSLNNQRKALQSQLDEIQLAIDKSSIYNPISGSVLNKLSMAHEIVGAGRPLYTIADMNTLNLKAYFSGNQLSDIKIGQELKVMIDTEDGMKSLKGELIWISPTAEFTPKTIQTKEDRVNLMYATKIKVKNDGSLKLGMPAEVYIK